jgi:hypothetical protein
MAMAGSWADDHVVTEDFGNRPPAQTFAAIPPRILTNQIFWVRCVISDQVTTNTTTITESNIAFTAANALQQAATYLALFDQYYLAEVFVTVANNTLVSSTSVSMPQIYTAIDYDNASNLGSASLISGYSTCNSTTLGPGKSITRYLKPCVSPSLGGVGGAGVARIWVDNAFNSVPFYGFRQITQNTPAGAQSLDRTWTCTWAFRNNV